MAEQRSTPRGSSRCEVVRRGTGRAIVFIAVALALVSMVSAASAASQTWYLSNDTHTPKWMYKVGASPCSVVNLPVQNDYQIWIANEAAETAVEFTGNWSANMSFVEAQNNHDFRAEIGVWDNLTSAFTSKGVHNGTIIAKILWANFSIPVTTQFIVPKDSYLAFRLTNTNHPNKTLSVNPCSSRVTSPSTDPSYPVPELATVVLFGVGLLALVGYVGYRKKKLPDN